MPTNLKRYTVTLSPEFERILVADAEASDRHVATQLVWAAKQYYLTKQRELDVFRPIRPNGPDRREEAVFHAPPPGQALEGE